MMDALPFPARAPEARLAVAARRFHEANPEVYRRLVELARALRAKGFQRYGIAGLFEVLRYEVSLRTFGDHFRLNNNHRSWFARKIMTAEPDLAGFFLLRDAAADLR